MDFKDLSVYELPHAINAADCFKLCPTMDLISFQLSDQVIWIYRRGNEKVWDIESDGHESDRIIELIWRPDGQTFTILKAKGGIEIYNAMDGCLIRSLKLEMSISSFEWFHKQRPNTSQSTDDNSLGGILQNFDIIQSLPLLSLELNGKELSATNRYRNNTENILDYLIVGSDDGYLSYIFSGIFVVDRWELPEKFKGFKILDIVSNESSSNNYLIAKNKAEELSLLKLSTGFINKEKTDFANILLIVSKLLNLTENIKTAINQVNNYYKPYFEYTIRIIELLRGELKDEEQLEAENHDITNKDSHPESNNNDDPVYDLYDLLLTGSLSKATKKWLTDYLSDRGIKRWTKLGRTYFDNSRNLVFNDLIGSLHQLIIHLTDLKGHCEWNEETSLDISAIENAREVSGAFLKYLYKFMTEMNDSQRCFDQMILWLTKIFSEVTTDEKLNVSYNTKDITTYLMFINTKLNSIEGEKKIIESDFKVNNYCKILGDHLDHLFDKIKADIKHSINVEKSIELPIEFSGSESVNMRIYGSLGYIYTLLGDTEIQILVFDINTMKCISRKFSTHEKITDVHLLSDNQLLILTETSISNYSIGENLLDLKDQFLFNDLSDTEFEGKRLMINENRKVVCILDKSLKKYAWINY